MRASCLSISALIAALAAWSPAAAAPLDGATLQNRLPGAEIRTNFLGSRGMEDHVWRLQADGTMAAAYMRAPIANDRGALEYGSGVGRWAANGGQLCIQMQGVFAGEQACFVVDVGPGNRVTLIGGNARPTGSTFSFAPQPGLNQLPILRGTIHMR